MLNKKKTDHWWVSTYKWTCYVRTKDMVIVKGTAPILKKFIGQPLSNLVRWGKKIGDCKVQKLPATPKKK